VEPTRAALERVLEWSEPARRQLGLDVEVPESNGAQRARASVAEGRPIEEYYRHAMEETRDTYAPSLASVVDD